MAKSDPALIKIKGLPSEVPENSIVSYFQDSEIGGGAVKRLDKTQDGCTLVTFENSEAVKTFMSNRPHHFNGVLLEVECCQQTLTYAEVSTRIPNRESQSASHNTRGMPSSGFISIPSSHPSSNYMSSRNPRDSRNSPASRKSNTWSAPMSRTYKKIRTPHHDKHASRNPREPRVSHNPRDSPASRNPRDSPASSNLRESPTSCNVRDSPSSRNPRDSPASRNPRDSPSSCNVRDSPSSRNPRDSPASRNPRDSPSSRNPRDSPLSRNPRVSPAFRNPRDSPSSRNPRDSPSSRDPRDSTSSRNPRDSPASRCAWVTLVMLGDGYAAGALAVAQSLRMVQTKYDLVCMVTPDVTHPTRRHLCVMYDHVIEVPYIQHRCRKLWSEKQSRMYDDWIEFSFTKWNCLNLVQYERVMFIDADMVVKVNSDDLFELPAPASVFPTQNAPCYYNPYLKPDTEITFPPEQGALMNPIEVFKRAKETNNFLAFGGLVLLRPDKNEYKSLCEFIHEQAVFGEGLRTASGADEVAISLFYARKGVSWTHIHHRYAVVPWRAHWILPHEPYILHIFGRPKPWEEGCDWPDPDWWGVVDDLLGSHPDLSELYPPRPAITKRPEIEDGMRDSQMDCGNNNNARNDTNLN